MNKNLSLIFLYNKAAYKRLILIFMVIPILFAGLFLLKTGGASHMDSFMLMERGFGGIWAVLAFVIINVIASLTVANSLNDKKSLKASHSTPGYTIRRMHISPISSYIMVYVYYILVMAILWGIAIVSLYVIGRTGITLSGSGNAETKIALGMLRTDIGHALLPIAHPQVLLFNIVAVLALGGECARSCYLSWHNGRQTAGVLLIAICMFVVWAFELSNSYMLMVILVMVLYAGFSFGDVISREKKPKGDPFMVNKYVGMIDMDSTDFDENAFMQTNSKFADLDPESDESLILERYEAELNSNKGLLQRLNPFYLRKRYLPIGINMERANFIFGACLFVGIAEKIAFYGKYMLKLQDIDNSITGVTIDSAMKMPYFWDLQRHAYYGYIIAIILVFVLQAYLIYNYYNKETKSIFVMKRLPNRKEYTRTIWIAPAVESIFIFVVMIAQTILDMGIYIAMTPKAALPSDYLSHLLPF